LAPDVICEPASDLKLHPIPQEILGRIKKAELLVAIITQEGDSCWIQNELGMAYALEKPILVFYEEGMSTEGFVPMVSEYVKFKRDSLADLVNDKPRLIHGIQEVVAINHKHQQEQEALTEQRNLGVIGVYPDRKDTFTNFREFWDKEKESIHIVASTLEGFRKFVGDAGQELIEEKLRRGCNIQILMTDPDYLKFRAISENVKESGIRDQFYQTIDQLKSIAIAKPGKLEVRTIETAPTCFTIITNTHMLLNPYPYMRTAYSCFGLIVRCTTKRDDVYHTYHDFHFQRAWNRAEAVDLFESVALYQ
jgi:hypothetical protein